MIVKKGHIINRAIDITANNNINESNKNVELNNIALRLLHECVLKNDDGKDCYVHDPIEIGKRCFKLIKGIPSKPIDLYSDNMYDKTNNIHKICPLFKFNSNLNVIDVNFNDLFNRILIKEKNIEINEKVFNIIKNYYFDYLFIFSGGTITGKYIKNVTIPYTKNDNTLNKKVDIIDIPITKFNIICKTSKRIITINTIDSRSLILKDIVKNGYNIEYDIIKEFKIETRIFNHESRK